MPYEERSESKDKSKDKSKEKELTDPPKLRKGNKNHIPVGNSTKDYASYNKLA